MAGKLPKRRNATVPDLKTSLKIIQEFLLNKRKDIVPEGFYSVAELAAAWKKSKHTTGNILKKSVKAGLCETRQFFVTRKPAAYYRFKETK